MPHAVVMMRVAVSIAAVALVTAAYSRVLQVNPTTVAMTYLVVILLIAMGWGIAEATAASLAAVLCLNFFFLPPVGTLTIADPQNWVARLVFLITAVVTSQLSGRARLRHVEAVARQGDLERLYALSRAFLLSDRSASVSGGIARQIASVFELPAVGLYDRRKDIVSWAGSADSSAVDAKLREVARTGVSWHEPSRLIVTAIQLGGAPIGSLAICDAGLDDTVLQSIANLAAIGLERARALEATAHAEAARESSELRATNLKAQRLSFGAAQQAADALRDAVEALAPVDPAKDQWHVRALAATALAGAREIQALQAPHIAEADDATMTALEGRMAAAEAAVRTALQGLAGVVRAASRPQLAAAVGALDRLMEVNTQIIGLSRRNTNVRSLAMSLNEKGKLTTACEDRLRALQAALAKRGFTATR